MIEFKPTPRDQAAPRRVHDAAPALLRDGPTSSIWHLFLQPPAPIRACRSSHSGQLVDAIFRLLGFQNLRFARRWTFPRSSSSIGSSVDEHVDGFMRKQSPALFWRCCPGFNLLTGAPGPEGVRGSAWMLWLNHGGQTVVREIDALPRPYAIYYSKAVQVWLPDP